MSTIGNAKNSRVNWVDVAKFIGIFSIYLGHFTEAAGPWYLFVFKFHVPLFFFLSGCTFKYDSAKTFKDFIVKKCLKILLPFFAFALLSVLVKSIISGASLSTIGSYLVLIITGCIRNKFFAPGLWFLTALFIIEILFKLLTLLKNKYIILSISFIVFLLISNFVTSKPNMSPIHYYNFDWAIYYLICFAIGFYLYPHINNFFKLDTTPKKVSFIVCLVVTFAFAVVMFFNKINIVKYFKNQKMLVELNNLVVALILILLVLLISNLLSGVKIFSAVGQETLYLCGNEYIIKKLFPCFLSIFGIEIQFSNPLVTIIYTAVLIFICYRLLIPFEKLCVNSVKKIFRNEK